jgi:GntR family transcriptional regulator
MFEGQGLIRRRQGSGTFVVGQIPVIEAGLEILESIDTMARRLNLEISVSDLHVEQFTADEDHARGLGVDAGSKLTLIRRVIREETRPVAYLVDTLPESCLKIQDLPTSFKGSVLDFLLERGDPLTVSRAAISAAGAVADVAKALEIQRGDVLLQLTAQLYHSDGHVVDYSHSYFIPGYFHFHVVRRVGG